MGVSITPSIHRTNNIRCNMRTTLLLILFVSLSTAAVPRSRNFIEEHKAELEADVAKGLNYIKEFIGKSESRDDASKFKADFVKAAKEYIKEHTPELEADVAKGI